MSNVLQHYKVTFCSLISFDIFCVSNTSLLNFSKISLKSFFKVHSVQNPNLGHQELLS